MATPFLVGAAVLVVVPAAGAVVLSLHEWDLVRPPRFLGLANFHELFDDPVFRISLRNSMLHVVVAVPMRLLGAVGLALLLHRGGRATRAARVAVLTPTVIPDVAYALVWLWILNPLYGPLNLTLGSLGMPTPAWLSQPAPARWAVIVMSVFQLGEGFLIALAARRHVPDELLELASVNGARAWGRLTRVTLPLMAPALLLVVMRDTITVFQSTFVPALIVTDGGPPPFATTTLPLFIHRTAFEYLRYGYASAATVLALVLTASVLWLQYLSVRRWIAAVPRAMPRRLAGRASEPGRR